MVPSFDWRGRGGSFNFQSSLLERTTPSAPAKEASPLFLNGRSHPCYVEIVKRLFYFHHRGLVQFCYNALGLGGGQGNAGKQPERRPRGQHRSGVSLRVPRVKESKKTSGLAQSDKSIKKMSSFLISPFSSSKMIRRFFVLVLTSVD